jgi:hypothetical protein
MSRMIRKKVYIAPEQDQRLKRIARELKTTEANIIRQSLDRLFTFGVHSLQNPDIWKQELEFIRMRPHVKVPRVRRPNLRERSS